jgi:mannose-6-phosphate isomerase class I
LYKLYDFNNCIPDIIRLEPAFKDNLWGGTKLRAVFGKKCVYDVIGESW